MSLFVFFLQIDCLQFICVADGAECTVLFILWRLLIKTYTHMYT